MVLQGHVSNRLAMEILECRTYLEAFSSYLNVFHTIQFNALVLISAGLFDKSSATKFFKLIFC